MTLRLRIDNDVIERTFDVITTTSITHACHHFSAKVAEDVETDANGVINNSDTFVYNTYRSFNEVIIDNNAVPNENYIRELTDNNMNKDEPFLSETFESYASTIVMALTWTIVQDPSTSVTLDTTNGLVNLKCIRMYDDNTNGRCTAYRTFTGKSKGYMRFFYNSTYAGSSTFYVWLGNSTGGVHPIKLKIVDTDFQYYKSGSGYTSLKSDASKDAYWRVEVWWNCDLGTYGVRINGEEAIIGEAFDGATLPSTINKFYILTDTSTKTDAYLDIIECWDNTDKNYNSDRYKWILEDIDYNPSGSNVLRKTSTTDKGEAVLLAINHASLPDSTDFTFEAKIDGGTLPAVASSNRMDFKAGKVGTWGGIVTIREHTSYPNKYAVTTPGSVPLYQSDAYEQTDDIIFRFVHDSRKWEDPYRLDIYYYHDNQWKVLCEGFKYSFTVEYDGIHIEEVGPPYFTFDIPYVNFNLEAYHPETLFVGRLEYNLPVEKYKGLVTQLKGRNYAAELMEQFAFETYNSKTDYVTGFADGGTTIIGSANDYEASWADGYHGVIFNSGAVKGKMYKITAVGDTDPDRLTLDGNPQTDGCPDDNTGTVTSITDDTNIVVNVTNAVSADEYKNAVIDITLVNGVIVKYLISTHAAGGAGTDVTFTCDEATFTSDQITAADAVKLYAEFSVGLEYSKVVEDLIDKYSLNLTAGTLEETTYYTATTYNKIVVYDIMLDLATVAEYDIIVNNDKTLDFVPTYYESSGEQFVEGEDQIITPSFPKSGRDIINKVSVFGAKIHDRQITATVEDAASIDYYGIVKEHKIVDTNIDSDDAATDLANQILEENAYDIKIGRIKIVGIYEAKPGQTINLEIPSQEVSGTYLILEESYNSYNTTEFEVASGITEHQDFLIKLIKKMKKKEVETADVDIYIKTQTVTERLIPVVVSMKIYERDYNDSFIMDTSYGQMDVCQMGNRAGAETLVTEITNKFTFTEKMQEILTDAINQASTGRLRQFGVGSGITLPKYTDTSLGAQILRKAIHGVSWVDFTNVTIDCKIVQPGSSVSYTEFGLFRDISALLGFRAVFDEVTKDTDKEHRIEFKFDLGFE